MAGQRDLRNGPEFFMGRGSGKLPPMAKPILFRCPNTGMNVQHWLADAPEDEKDRHSSVVCPACAKMHFIHNSTGKPLGEK